MYQRTISRRETLKWLAGLTGTLVLGPRESAAVVRAFDGSKAAGTDADPNRSLKSVPWELKLSEQELDLISVVCDVILPKAPSGPAASAVGVPDFVNEWVSAPFQQNMRDHGELRAGLRELKKGLLLAASGKPWGHLNASEKANWISGFISNGRALEGFLEVARRLTAVSYFTTKIGMDSIGYVGNVPLTTFEGPSEDVRRALGLVK